jgi:hypothetical protein
MATYRDFQRSHKGPTPKVKRLYWLCGDEVILRELALESIKKWAAVDDMNYRTLTAGSVTDGEIWDALLEQPGDHRARRLLVVREAQRLKSIEPVKPWLEDKTARTSSVPGTTVVFVSADDEWAVGRYADERERVMASTAALYVRCHMPNDQRETRGAEIITGGGNINDLEARRLYRRVGGDMSLAYGVMRKAAYFDRPLEGQFLTALSPPNPQDDIVDALLGLEKKRALAVIDDLSREEMGRVIGRLTSHLDLMARLEPHAGTRTPLREIASRIGVSEQWVRHLLPLLKFYPRKAVFRRVVLLGKVDAAWQRGQKQGLMEVLVAAW